jgi:hypothetical protein
MFKKLNYKTLLIAFGILLLLVVVMQISKRKNNDSNFKSQIVQVDTSKITAVYIKMPDKKDEIKLIKSGKTWNIVLEGKNIRPDEQAIMGMIIELSNIKAERVAATEKSEWGTYQVTDSAIRVRVEQEGKIQADFLVGKFSYQQNPQKFSTYVRLWGEDEVYSVPSFLAMTFGKGINDFRDKSLTAFNAKNVTRVTFTYPGDSSFVLSATNNIWKIGDISVDSAKCAQYLQSIQGYKSYELASEKSVLGAQVFSVKFEGNNMPAIEIKAFASDSISKYIITSNQNPGALFSGANGEIMKKFCISKKYLIGKK